MTQQQQKHADAGCNRSAGCVFGDADCPLAVTDDNKPQREWGRDSEDVGFLDEIGVLMCSSVDGLGFCGCGRPEDVADVLRRYLDSVAWNGAEYSSRILKAKLSRERLADGESEESKAYKKISEETKARHGLADDAFLLCAYIADDKKLTEHGGSVYGAWLTERGKKWLAEITAALNERKGQHS